MRFWYVFLTYLLVAGTLPLGAQAAVPPDFARISGGTFMMGSPASEAGRRDNETRRRVAVSGFYIGKYEVTQVEWKRVMGTNPSEFSGDHLPVDGVSWNDAVAYCNKRSALEGLTPAYTLRGTTVTWDKRANGYRLPTEAEWEYACRAGTTTPFYTGTSVDSAGWYDGNSGGTTHAAGQKTPNAWGLYDMHGNVWEWCWDAASGDIHVLRGGSWDYDADYARSAYRGGDIPSATDGGLGFRVCRSR
jgi:formylglycine-generating enzyme required for sulfatase activity